LTSFGNPNSIRFSPGNGGAITVRLANNSNSLIQLNQSRAQVMVGHTILV